MLTKTLANGDKFHFTFPNNLAGRLGFEPRSHGFGGRHNNRYTITLLFLNAVLFFHDVQIVQYFNLLQQSAR